METLDRRKRNAERRGFCIKKSSPCIALHNSNTYIFLFADTVKLFSFRINTVQAVRIFFHKVIIKVFAWRQKVKSRIDAEQDHFDLAMKSCHFCHCGVVGAHSDVTDDSGFFQFLDIGNKFAGHDLFKFIRAVNKVDHAQINVIRLHSCKKITESFINLIKLSGTFILAVLPGGADVSLNDPFVPAAFDRISDIGADIWLRHPAVQNIDSLFLTYINDLFYLFCVVAFQPFASKTDLTDLETCFSKCTVLHNIFLL